MRPAYSDHSRSFAIMVVPTSSRTVALSRNKSIVMPYLAWSTYLAILLSLVLFSVFSTLYIYKPTRAQSDEPSRLDFANFTATDVACAYPTSGQYGVTLQSTYFILLAATVILRNQQWLAAGIAASALTYSGTSATHQIILYILYGRYSHPADRVSCTVWTNNEVNNTLSPALPICVGVYDPDFAMACTIVGAGLLAALPMAMWSSTFHGVATKPILVLWTLLLAIGHIFYNLVVPDEHTHYQICPAGLSEALPETSYVAPAHDTAWDARLSNIVQGMTISDHQSRCIYSCFESNAYLGRRSNEIGFFRKACLKLKEVSLQDEKP